MTVFQRLRGLESCDGVSIPSNLALTKPHELEALDFLYKVSSERSR